VRGDPLASRETLAERSVSITVIEGYTSAELPAPWLDDSSLNSVFGRDVIPLLRIEAVRPVHDAISLVSIGSSEAGDERQGGGLPACDWGDSGDVHMTWT